MHARNGGHRAVDDGPFRPSSGDADTRSARERPADGAAPARGLCFLLLGPLEGWSQGTRLRLSGTIQERVLATLLLEPGRLVPVSRLVQAAWEENPPATAGHQVRKAVADLRRRIPRGSEVIVTDGPGYRAALAGVRLDLLEFGAHLRSAASAESAGRIPDAVRELTAALALWRGPVLAGTGAAVIDAAAAILEERRVTAAEQLFALRLTRGDGKVLVADLRDLVAAHPLRETLRGQLMLALYRSGRQAEALEEYGRVRALLAEELGVDPGPHLAGLYEDMLRDSVDLLPARGPLPSAEPSLRRAGRECASVGRRGQGGRAGLARAAGAAGTGAGTGAGGSVDGHGEAVGTEGAGSAGSAGGTGSAGSGRSTGPAARAGDHGGTGTAGAAGTTAPVPVGTPGPPSPQPPKAPCTLPYDLSDFTGRRTELARIIELATDPAREYRTRIVALDGMGGSGKTSLAVHAAHQLAGDYPDGQLHLDLRGFTPGEEGMRPETALDVLLRMLGTPGERIPTDLQSRAALWRSSLVGRRVLLLLDNAVDAAQLHPLLTAAPGCLVLITSRARLVHLDGASWLSLGLLPPEDSAALVAETLGADRVAAEPDAAAELIERCGHLPLALRIATARLRNRPRWTLAYLVDRLRDETRRMVELTSGERGVAATLRLSYLAMTERHRTALRVLAMHPGARIDAHAAAALLGLDLFDAEDLLEHLLDVHLLQQPDIGQYTFHDLVRSFARELPTSEEEEAAATERLFGYYVSATEAACQVLFPGRMRHPTKLPPYEGELPPLGDADAARRWFALEHKGLIAATALASGRGLDRHIAVLARNLVFHLNARGHFTEYAEVARTAAAAARRTGDLWLLSCSLSNLGVACWKLGLLKEGIETVTEAREAAVQAGNRLTEAHADSVLGILHATGAGYEPALFHLRRSLALALELGAERNQADVLCTLSTVYEELGRHAEAAEAAREAAGISLRLGYLNNQVTSLTDLAFAEVGLGDASAAGESLARARALCDERVPVGDTALMLALSARVAQLLGDTGAGHGFAARALALATETDAPLRRAKTQNVVARFHFHAGAHGTARALHEQAHRSATRARLCAEEWHALSGMASAARELGAPEASTHQAAANALLTRLGLARPPAER
ncbi:BTAD domain-containing putative transcriptional regulator [Streptomyces sp. NPDC005774]|uniref:AfsR/SARP family transcriptional regulator n=1 Tax=Streptomyces sp. NPDC005774 TaxID=3364728 RepID=UPI00369BA545